MKKVITLSMVALITLTGCNAVKGLGKDIQKGAEIIHENGKKSQSQ
ncbi:entericidin [Moraxella oblonga]|nr:entericidin [Moraxella oblonga]